MTSARPPQAWSAPGLPIERPSTDPRELEIWCYTDRFTYEADDEVEVRVHTTAPTFSLFVMRDGERQELVHRQNDLRGVAAETPDDAYATGCDWPVAARFVVDGEWRPGFYLLIVRAEIAGEVCEREHFIVVRANRTDRPRVALLLTTSTLLAYNDWGGANHYRGLLGEPWIDVPSAVVSARRPLARGFLRLPPSAPREAHHDTPPPLALPRYPALEWAEANGFCRHYADAFWATYERPFVQWAEREGYDLDYLTQHDLHFDPSTLDDCEVLVIVGHDEYWSWQMRDAADAFVNRGGFLARFAGNFTWQVRLSQDGSQQTCFKAPELDPLSADPELRHLTTTHWEAVGRPAAQTMGLTGITGIYNRYGNAAPRSSGGFTVYRPDHWALSGTGLCYGDLLGGPPAFAAAFELDGVDYTFRRGLPYPTGSDGAPDGLEIIALAPAVIGEIDEWEARVPINAWEKESDDFYMVDGSGRIERQPYGSGMVASFKRGEGTVFNAGSTEWVNGLIVGDPFIEQVTRNVLNRRSRTC